MTFVEFIYLGYIIYNYATMPGDYYHLWCGCVHRCLRVKLAFSLSFFYFYFFYAVSLLFYVYSQVFLRPVTFKHTTETPAAFNISYPA